MEVEETKDGLTRRNFLGSTAVGVLAAGLTAGSLLSPREAHAALTFPHVALDVEKVREYGYYWYQKGPGCGHGSARALIQGFVEACNAAGQTATGWHELPRSLYAWSNGGGPSGWGTLCGAIAGSVGVLNLLGLHGTLGPTVFEWYVQQNFPLATLDSWSGVDAGAGTILAPIKDADVKGHSIPDSPLCHVSVSKWLAAANSFLGEKNAAGQGLKEDRCGKVTGDTAAFTAYLLNEKLAGRNPAPWAKPAAMASCFDCHDPAGTAGVTSKTSQTKMDCLPCHTEPVSGRK